MADAFEQDLALLLDEPPALEGGDAFAAGVEARIERAWRLRRWGFGLAALAGALVTVASLARAPSALGELELAFAGLSGLAASADAFWLAAACLVVLAAIAIPRALADS